MYGGKDNTMPNFKNMSALSKGTVEKNPKKYNKYFDWLEDLRKSGITNMFGAVPYLQARFSELSEQSATNVLSYWMQNYEELMTQRGWTR